MRIFTKNYPDKIIFRVTAKQAAFLREQPNHSLILRDYINSLMSKKGADDE